VTPQSDVMSMSPNGFEWSQLPQKRLWTRQSKWTYT